MRPPLSSAAVINRERILSAQALPYLGKLFLHPSEYGRGSWRSHQS